MGGGWNSRRGLWAKWPVVGRRRARWQWFGVEEFPWPVALEKWSWAAAGPAEEVGMSGKASTAGTTGRVVEDPRWVGVAAAGASGGETGLE